MKKTLYYIPVNEGLIWDYEWKEENYKIKRKDFLIVSYKDINL